MLAPSTITRSTIDPPAALFDSAATLSQTPSTDRQHEALPIINPAVSATCLLPPSLCPARHATVVSDLHVVASQTVAPATADGLPSTSPMPSPCTVTLTTPEAAALTGRPPPNLAMSAEHTPLLLPARLPPVIETRLLLPPASPVRQRVDESDSQDVPSHPVPPAAPATLIMPSPMPPPTTRTLADPVTPTLRPPTMLVHPEAADTAHVTLPVSWHTDRAAVRLATFPQAVRARTAVSDAHTLHSHELSPVLPHALCAADPRLSP
jgi:hypothetical protein